jgi:hypothetical protein
MAMHFGLPRYCSDNFPDWYLWEDLKLALDSSRFARLQQWEEENVPSEKRMLEGIRAEYIDLLMQGASDKSTMNDLTRTKMDAVRPVPGPSPGSR